VFPLAHAWLLARVVPEPVPAHYLGCVWPDMLFESPLSHPQSHRSGAALAAYAKALADAEDAATLHAFVTGVLTHGSEPHGFDWYSDEEYRVANPPSRSEEDGGRPAEERGYAFQRGKALSSDAAAACDVPEYQGWWKAHNFIEMGFEHPLYAAHPELGDQLAAACTDERLMEQIARHLAGFFGQPAEGLATPMRRFREVVLFRPETAGAWAEKYALQTRLKHSGAQPNVAAIARLIERAEGIIAADGQAYLDDCATRVGAMLREVGLS